MQNIGRQEAQILRTAINEALKKVEEEHDVKCSIGNITFAGDHMRTRLTVNAVNANGETVDQEARDFRNHCYGYGLGPDDLGVEFRNSNGTFTITGCNPRSYKYPILAKSHRNGKTYKFPPHAICRYLGRGTQATAVSLDETLG